jgi:hypothetical protein
MSAKCDVLIMGASYGALLAAKLLLAGHDVKLVCLPAESELINKEGIRVRLPIRDRAELLEIDSRALRGKLTADVPKATNPAGYDLVVLAMQEPQYRSPGVRELLEAVARSRVRCMSIMNMPPLPFLARIRDIDLRACRECYADATVWDAFDPTTMTLCSPDPQAFRPPEAQSNVLQVRLATNFKAARFASEADTALLRRLESDIDAVRFDTGAGAIELPVKLRVHDSIYVPLAKWAMLIAGNYRCIQNDAMRSIKDAVHSDLEATRAVYEWVVKVCIAYGASPRDMVPFEKYAGAALALESPSSAARALFGGAPHIERVDRLVQTLAAQKTMRLAALDEIVARVDARLDANRRHAG